MTDTGASHPAARESKRPTPFIWPPAADSPRAQQGGWDGKKGEAHAPDDPHPPAPGARRTSLRRLLEDAERFWLAPTALPLRRRLAETPWTPARTETACDRCGEPVGPYESDEFACRACRDKPLPYNRFVRLGLYEPPLSDWIAEIKFTRSPGLARDLGRLLATRLAAAGAAPKGEKWIVVPVASAWRRRVARGVDHAGAIAEGVSRGLGVPLVRALRASARPSQRSVPVSRRRANVAGAFRRRRGVSLEGRTVILVDDVRTTGATLGAAAWALVRPRAGGARSVWAATLAVAADPWRGAHAGTEEGEAEDGEGVRRCGGEERA